MLLLARLPLLDRVAGFDRLTVWHRWNGYACLLLVLAHTVMAVEGYALDGTALVLPRVLEAWSTPASSRAW